VPPVQQLRERPLRRPFHPRGRPGQVERRVPEGVRRRAGLHHVQEGLPER